MRICVCCAGGITSRLLVRVLSESRPDDTWEFSSISESFLEEASDEMDVLLLAPHIELSDRQRSLLEDSGVTIAVIGQDAYAEKDVEAVYAIVAETLRVEDSPEGEAAAAGEGSPGDAASRAAERLRSATQLLKRPFFSVIVSAMSAVGVPMILGSVLMTVLSLPFPAFQDLLSSTGIDDVLRIPIDVSTNLVALYVALAIGFCYARVHGLDAFWTSVLAVLAFLCSIGPDLFGDAATALVGQVRLDMSYLGPYGMFPAMACALLACSLTRRVSVALSARSRGGVDAVLLERAAGAAAVLVPFSLAFWTLRLLTGHALYDVLNGLVQLPFALVSTSVLGFVAFLVLGGAIWLVGLHGNMLAYAAIAPAYSMMYYANIAAFAAGEPAPYAVWFLVPFVYIGGTGCTLALNLLLLTVCKSRRARSVGAMCIASSLCNIGEPMVFGVPVILSRSFALPFLLCPLVNLAICCLAMFGLGVVPPPTGAAISIYYPVGISAALTSGSLSAWVLWALLLLVDMAIYYPFARRFDEGDEAPRSE